MLVKLFKSKFDLLSEHCLLRLTDYKRLEVLLCGLPFFHLQNSKLNCFLEFEPERLRVSLTLDTEVAVLKTSLVETDYRVPSLIASYPVLVVRLNRQHKLTEQAEQITQCDDSSEKHLREKQA